MYIVITLLESAVLKVTYKLYRQRAHKEDKSSALHWPDTKDGMHLGLDFA